MTAEPTPERRELPATMLEPCSFDDTPEPERTPPDDSTPVRDEHGPLSRSRLRREAITAGREPVQPDDTAEDLTSPAVAGPTYAAVYDVIRKWPGTAERNAVIWRAVQAYQAALMVDPATGRHPLDALAEVRCGHKRHQWMCVNCAADAVRPDLERLQQRLTVLQDREEEVIDPLRCQVSALQAEVERLKNELGQHRLDEQYEAMATAGAFDEEDPF